MSDQKIIKRIEAISVFLDEISFLLIPWGALTFVYSTTNPFAWPIIGKWIFVFFATILSGAFKNKLFNVNVHVNVNPPDDDDDGEECSHVKPVPPFTKKEKIPLN